MTRQQSEEQKAVVSRWMNRDIGKSMTNEELFFDPSAQVGRLMGGREFFFRIGAKFIHRIGLMRGMGWELPYGEAKGGIDYIRISVRPKGGGTYDILFGRRTDKREGLDVGAGIVNPFGIEIIRTVEDVPPAHLREVYDRETTTEMQQCP